MIREIEIKDIGKFIIKLDLLHRGQNPRLKTFNNNEYKTVQFNSFVDDEKGYQLGYDHNGKEIQIRVVI
tara:strand:+ start:11849 stop:12055 length:207 start_codon:yes stop_codon:yes gene_type:complete